MDEANQYDPPAETGLDRLHQATKAGLAIVPVLGGGMAELFSVFIAPPIAVRREEWMTRVGLALRKLEDRTVDLDSLKNNEEFISIVSSASQVALRNHRIEKLDALENAILNSALKPTLEDDIKQTFVRLIDELTPIQFEILRSCQKPIVRQNLSMGAISSIIFESIPELRGKNDYLTLLWRELFARGLVNVANIKTTMSANDLAEKRTTELGDQFLSFISND